MLTKNRPMATLLLACATAGAVAPAAVAATAKPASVGTILADCKTDSQISHRYRLADLKKAKSKITSSKANRKKYSSACTAAVNSSIAALSGKAGKNSVDAIVKECSTGTIKHKYKLATLKKAAKTLPADVKNYGDCGNSLESQIHTLS